MEFCLVKTIIHLPYLSIGRKNENTAKKKMQIAV